MKLPSQAVTSSRSNTNTRRIRRHLHERGQEWSRPGFRHRQGRISALVRPVAVTFPTGVRRWAWSHSLPRVDLEDCMPNAENVIRGCRTIALAATLLWSVGAAAQQEVP